MGEAGVRERGWENLELIFPGSQAWGHTGDAEAHEAVLSGDMLPPHSLYWWHLLLATLTCGPRFIHPSVSCSLAEPSSPAPGPAGGSLLLDQQPAEKVSQALLLPLPTSQLFPFSSGILIRSSVRDQVGGLWTLRSHRITSCWWRGHHSVPTPSFVHRSYPPTKMAASMQCF